MSATRRASSAERSPNRNPKLFTDLVNQFRGPILVIGGGPSVPRDLEELRGARYDFKTTISANEHGFHQVVYRIGYVVAADGVHHEKRKRMDHYLEQLGAPKTPMISPAWFADYRLPDWRLAANTGLTAIAIAAAMGGGPIVVTGLDFYKLTDPNAPTYYHDPGGASGSNKKTADHFSDQCDAMHDKIGTEHQIRPMSGPLLQYYPRWNPHEIRKPGPLPEFAQMAIRQATHIMRAHRSKRWNLTAMQVDREAIVACSPLEARAAKAGGNAQEIGVRPAPWRDPNDVIKP